MICYICEGRETIESVVGHQLTAEQGSGPAPSFIALCGDHIGKAERAYQDIKKIQTRAVLLNLPGLKVGGLSVGA